MPTDRFPPPWSIEEQAACFVVRDAGGRALGYFYFEDEPGRRSGREAAHQGRGAADRDQRDEAAGAGAPQLARALFALVPGPTGNSRRIDPPNGKPHFVMASETPINADMRVRTDKQAIQHNRETNNRSKSDIAPGVPVLEAQALGQISVSTQAASPTASRRARSSQRHPNRHRHPNHSRRRSPNQHSANLSHNRHSNHSRRPKQWEPRQGPSLRSRWPATG